MEEGGRVSSKDQSRRTTAEVVFDGTDISRSILPYLLSMTYTDNEEDEADDLQIKLLDRDNIWLEKWLNDAIDAAASTTSTTGNTAGGTYSVTANSGLNVRSGPGTSYSILGALAYGSSITVSAVENGWATINYSGKTAYVSASYIKQGGKDSSGSGSAVTRAIRISAVYVRENCNDDGVDKVLNCGQF